MKKNKHNPIPTERVIDNISYLRSNDNTEAKRVVEASKNLPHLQKPPKFLLK